MVCELFLNKTVYMYFKKPITLVLGVWIQMNYLLVFELLEFEYNGTLTFISTRTFNLYFHLSIGLLYTN